MAEQRGWLTHTAYVQCTLEGREEAQMVREQFYAEIFILP